MRRYRSWACTCCGREWGRRRGESNWLGECPTCGRTLVAAQAPKIRRECVHARDAARVRAAVERTEGRPRTRGGRVLSPPSDVRVAWREVRRARTRPAVARRGQKFVDALLAYSRAEGPAKRLRYELKDGRLRATRPPGGGLTGTPRVRLDKLAGDVWGVYRQALFKGVYEIALNSDAPSCDHLRATLIHETLHLLDADARLSDRGHGAHWGKRLAIIEAMFPAEGLG